ncbi:MAG: ATP-binding cassette domain-containing protein [Bacilli bacterium]|nr:ATP-binding cassette domain-containing protein [Bacilli bacterium]
MLKINDLTIVFNKDQSVENHKMALNHVNLTVEEGDFITIIGGNGSGKSTLMNMICGVYQPDTGSIVLDDVDITNYSEEKRASYLGRVFQDPHMGTCANMSILENLEIASRRGEKPNLKWGFSKTKLPRYKELLASLDLGLEKRLTQKVGLLSGGQRQAVTLIMATLKQPRLLLLDEHTAALDPKTAKKVLDLTDKVVNENKITTIMITHNMKDAIKYGNRLLMLNDGKIIFDIKGEEKKNLTIEQLLEKFELHSDIEISDKMILS